MPERIDNAGMATAILNVLNTQLVNDGVAAGAAAVAQAYATLALVEQKRIENLIVLAGWVADAGKDSVGEALDSLRMGVAGEVWEGLGLSDD